MLKNTQKYCYILLTDNWSMWWKRIEKYGLKGFTRWTVKVYHPLPECLEQKWFFLIVFLFNNTCIYCMEWDPSLNRKLIYVSYILHIHILKVIYTICLMGQSFVVWNYPSVVSHLCSTSFGVRALRILEFWTTVSQFVLVISARAVSEDTSLRPESAPRRYSQITGAKNLCFLTRGAQTF